MKHSINIIAITLALAVSGLSAVAQEKGGQALLKHEKVTTQPAVVKTPEQPRVSAITKEKSKVSYSVHSRGFIQNPKTGETVAEIVTFRERGLWGNGCVTQLLLDNEGKPMAVLNSSASAGPGIALVQGASFVGGMYLFGEHLRPNNQNINSGNSGGGTTVNNSANAAGGNGGVANATGGSSSATGGSATANNSGSGTGGQTVNVNSGNANGNGVINTGGHP